MTRRISYYFLIFAACLFMSSPYASPEARDHGMHYKQDGTPKKYKKHHGWGMHSMLKKLDLSEEQRQQVKAISEEMKPQLKEQKAELRDVSKQIHTLAMSDNYDEGRVSDLADRKGDVIAELSKLKAAKMARIYALLTPEQKEKLADLRQKKKEKRDGKSEK